MPRNAHEYGRRSCRRLSRQGCYGYVTREHRTMSRKKTTPAIAYLRTSSATNVGVDKDSEKRQRVAIGVYAKRAGYELVAEFYDAAVSGADAIQDRPGFAALLDRIGATACPRCSSRTPVALPESSWRKSWASRCSSRAAST